MQTQKMSNNVLENQREINQQIIRILERMALRSKHMKCWQACPCDDGDFHDSCDGCGNQHLYHAIDVLKQLVQYE